MKKLENFSKALENLRMCRNYCAPYDVVTETGLVNLFCICFEQSWKAMKEVLENQGYHKTGSPKMIIKTAFYAGMKQDEAGWLELLEQRNEAAHTYNDETAPAMIERTKETYLGLFETLENELRENWL